MPTEKELKATTREIIQALYQSVVGIPSNPDDNGLIGDIKEIKEQIKQVNGRTRQNETRSKVNRAMIGVIIGGGGLATGITKILDLW